MYLISEIFQILNKKVYVPISITITNKIYERDDFEDTNDTNCLNLTKMPLRYNKAGALVIIVR